MQSSVLPLSEISLLDAQLAFEQWRENRPRREATPARLRTMAIELLSAHKRCDVAKALGVNTTTLKHWSEQASGAARNASEFIELPLEAEAIRSVKGHGGSPLSLSFRLPNGIEVCAQGHFTLEQLVGAFGTMEARS